MVIPDEVGFQCTRAGPRMLTETGSLAQPLSLRRPLLAAAHRPSRLPARQDCQWLRRTRDLSESDCRRRGPSPSELPRRRRPGPRATGQATVPVTPTTNHTAAIVPPRPSQLPPVPAAPGLDLCCFESCTIGSAALLAIFSFGSGARVSTLKDTGTELSLDSDTPRSSVRVLPYRRLRLMMAYFAYNYMHSPLC